MKVCEKNNGAGKLLSLGGCQRKAMNKKRQSHALWVSVQESNGGWQGTMKPEKRECMRTSSRYMMVW